MVTKSHIDRLHEKLMNMTNGNRAPKSGREMRVYRRMVRTFWTVSNRDNADNPHSIKIAYKF